MTLGSLWQLLDSKTKQWMLGGTVSVLAGTGLGVVTLPGFVESGSSDPLLLLPSLALCLGGGYAVLFPAISASRNGLRVFRDWRRHPRAGRILWVLSLAIAAGGLATCVVAGTMNPLAPGLLVWLFMGLYLASAGWASAVMGLSTEATGETSNGAPAEAQATVPSR
ncbi:hypothetical protein [Arthrobacter sp. Alg241-R88]|uniref:hypothetical protein n=1 Tax=Arthrobacter sp. Alg241-R88 TaxID=2305984 RepID=UPI0013D242CD|nr:hypothetical protein [Arthrobacter sp. Alg241-R88]